MRRPPYDGPSRRKCSTSRGSRPARRSSPTSGSCKPDPARAGCGLGRAPAARPRRRRDPCGVGTSALASRIARRARRGPRLRATRLPGGSVGGAAREGAPRSAGRAPGPPRCRRWPRAIPFDRPPAELRTAGASGGDRRWTDGRIDLARARREAKRLLAARGARRRRGRAARGCATSAPAGEAAKLADAQRVGRARARRGAAGRRLVRDCAEARGAAARRGPRAAASWSEATERAGATTPRRCSRSSRRSGARGSTSALVLGDVGAACARRWHGDAGVARRGRPGARDWVPLLYVTHSAFLGGERSDGLVACAAAAARRGRRPRRRAVAALRRRRREPGLPAAAARRRHAAPPARWRSPTPPGHGRLRTARMLLERGPRAVGRARERAAVGRALRGVRGDGAAAR